MTPSADIKRLIEIMAALRDPETGCPWDKEQSFATIAPYTVEEAHEVVDAIARHDMPDLREELGDLLLQVVYHARLAEETGAFDFGGVVEAITEKMIRRHPHVFGDEEARRRGVSEGFWEKIKAEEKRRRSLGRSPGGLLDQVAAGLPPLVRAMKLQRTAATVGFDWDDIKLVLDKLREEIDEIAFEIDRSSPSSERLSDEVGDLLFSVANLARHLKVDPEQSLRGTNNKFVSRFAFIEAKLASTGRSLDSASLEEMEALWQAAKRQAGPDADPLD
jgi:nucleoside triphosphate diphosphatase